MNMDEGEFVLRGAPAVLVKTTTGKSANQGTLFFIVRK